MTNQIERLNKAIAPLREEIIHHKLYAAIKDVDDLKIFMEYHVYAVWDFMSLLKALQKNLTCTTVPWFPKGSADTRYLINEIVCGEESDVDLDGNRKSHFELYLDAMNQCGADTSKINKFIRELQRTGDFETAFALSDAPEEVRDFVNVTFETINSDKDYLQSAVFTFGREDLIPTMFLSIVNDIHKNFPDNISIFKYYLERHIEVDGDHHSGLALQMTSHLCGSDAAYWEASEKAIAKSLTKRIHLWDGAYRKIIQRRVAIVEPIA